jgi:hypothetical protein
MQIKILSEYSKDIGRGYCEASRVLGIHHQYVRKAVSNLVRVTVENNRDVERRRQMYTKGFASCGWRECGKAYNA